MSAASLVLTVIAILVAGRSPRPDTLYPAGITLPRPSRRRGPGRPWRAGRFSGATLTLELALRWGAGGVP